MDYEEEGENVYVFHTKDFRDFLWLSTETYSKMISGMSNFKPPKLLSSGFIQSFLASYKSKSDKKHSRLFEGKWISIQTKDGVQLLALYHELQNPKGILILIHGWEGSIHSSYIVRTTRYFISKGYSIIRLNLRDHGDTHHLNLGLFNGSLLEETYEGIRILASQFNLPIYLAGFSLGGNFVLRIAGKHSMEKNANKIQNLKYCFSFSPALDPKEATLKMDKHPILRKYFLQSWTDSLRKKQNLFPHFYNFHDIDSYKTVMDLTKKMVLEYSTFESVDSYFDSYTLKNFLFQSIRVPSLILTAKDDPVIPWNSFYGIPLTPYLEVHVEDRGGHCGFIENFSRSAYYWKLMERKMA